MPDLPDLPVEAYVGIVLLGILFTACCVMILDYIERK